jgi:tRNA threonylcarbamoyladenosine biosynthesis protein TsaB
VITLAIDASTYTGTVAVFRDGALVSEAAAAMRDADRESLLPAVAQAVRESGSIEKDIVRIVCGAGPGSFTSLRIAASIAKGLAYGLRVPLDAVPSLGLVVTGQPLSAGSYLACLDALRGESYVAGYRIDEQGSVEASLPLQLVHSEHVGALANSIGAAAVGPSQRLHAMPHARGALKLATLAAPDVDVASWEPGYGRKAEAQAKWEAAHGKALPNT